MPKEESVDQEINEILEMLEPTGTRYHDLKARVDILNAAAIAANITPLPTRCQHQKRPSNSRKRNGRSANQDG